MLGVNDAFAFKMALNLRILFLKKRHINILVLSIFFLKFRDLIFICFLKVLAISNDRLNGEGHLFVGESHFDGVGSHGEH